MTADGMRIGEAAERAGVSTRTLRYYEQRGLLAPAGHSGGGERRYGEAEVARLQRIRDLSSLLGADLDEVGRVLEAEDRLARIRAEWRTGDPDRERRLALLEEAQEVREGLLARVQQRLAGLQALEQDVRTGLDRIAELRADLSAPASARR